MRTRRPLDLRLSLVIALVAVIAVVSASSVPVDSTSQPKAPEETAKSLEQPAGAKSELKATEERPAESSEAVQRKGRAEPVPVPVPTADVAAKADAKTPAPVPTEKPAQAAQAKPEPKVAAKGNKSQPVKSGSKSKLPPNLGTVTSTGSGSAHYMSKHDAYSAIAEKHGALAQDAMRKSDKRHLQAFGGIQKASGFGDVLSPFKGVTDSGLARTLGASMRSIMKGKYSVPAYVASALLGAVALMAFYESPISPLPVPPLPEPPIGRFPPEMPNISPNVQVPFRTNQQQQYGQQSYNQRSWAGQASPAGFQSAQVLFPGSIQPAQQRQMEASGPVQQLAANLLSVGKQQAAQRKSGLDYDPSSSRSFFGSSAQATVGSRVSSQASPQKQSSSLLSFFGLGSSASGADGQQPVANPKLAAAAAAAALSSVASASSVEPKGQSSSLSNSHIINKVKSYFSRSSSSASSSVSSANSNPYDQYQRMSFVQALIKDTAFLPGFLSPSRKSSSGPASSPASSLASQAGSSGGKLQSIGSALSGSGTNPAARMQVGAGTELSNSQISAAAKQKPSSGFGLARAADRIAHVLLETFSSGISQRNAAPAAAQSGSDTMIRKSTDDASGQSSLASATAFLNDIVSSYSANVAGNEPANHEQSKQSASSQQAQQAAHSQNQQPASQQQASVDASNANGRSSDSSSVVSAPNSEQAKQAASQPIDKQQVQQVQQAAASPAKPAATASVNAEGSALVRKTRSVGYEYPLEADFSHQRDQQPSKAAQINNVIDFVADSYTQNRLLFNFVMNQVGLSQAVPYVEQILKSGPTEYH